MNLTDTPANLEEAIAVLTQLADVAGPSSAGGDTSALDLAETRYRVLIEQIPAVTFLASLSGGGNEIYVSPQIESLLGFTQEEWVSDPVLWYEQIHPDDRDWISRDFAYACITGQPFRGVLRVYTRDRVLRWVQAEARFVRDEQGRLLFLQGAGFDVTEQFRSQEAREQLVREQAARAEADLERQRLQEMFTTLPAAIVVLRGPDHLVEFLNPIAQELAGDDAVGKPWQEAFPDFGRDVAAALDSVLASGQPVFLLQVRTGPSNRERYLDFTCQPLPDPGGPAMLLLIHAVDVTAEVLARREVEVALRLRDEAFNQLQESLRTREEFLSSAAHDLKTPVASIKGRAQLLNRRIGRMQIPDQDRLVESVAAIESSANRMAAMVEEFLDLARLQSGQDLVLERRPVDLVNLVQQAVADQQQQTERHRLRLETSETELVGTWDPARLARVIGNLLDNAVKYSPDGGEILVAIDVDRESPAQAVLRVQDHGVGIPEADLPRLFVQFQRASNVVGRIAGTGIGLSGSQLIAKAHGGAIEVESEAGRGSTFTVRLPINEE